MSPDFSIGYAAHYVLRSLRFLLFLLWIPRCLRFLLFIPQIPTGTVAANHPSPARVARLHIRHRWHSRLAAQSRWRRAGEQAARLAPVHNGSKAGSPATESLLR